MKIRSTFPRLVKGLRNSENDNNQVWRTSKIKGLVLWSLRFKFLTPCIYTKTRENGDPKKLRRRIYSRNCQVFNIWGLRTSVKCYLYRLYIIGIIKLYVRLNLRVKSFNQSLEWFGVYEDIGVSFTFIKKTEIFLFDIVTHFCPNNILDKTLLKLIFLQRFYYFY